MKKTTKPAPKKVAPELSIIGKNLTDRWIVVKEEVIIPKYRDLRFRIARASGGFGCNPESMGRAVFCTYVDGESVRWDRPDIERFATDTEVEAAIAESTNTHIGEGI